MPCLIHLCDMKISLGFIVILSFDFSHTDQGGRDLNRTEIKKRINVCQIWQNNERFVKLTKG